MKTKPILLVSLVFVISFILGMLTSAQIRNKKLQPVRQFLSEQRYVDGLIRTIEPTEEQQKDFEEIVQKFGKLNDELNKEFWDGFNSNMEAFRKEIDSKLTPEQLDKIKEIEEERQRMYEEFSRHRNDSSYSRNDRSVNDRNGVMRDPPGDTTPFPDDRRDRNQRNDFEGTSAPAQHPQNDPDAR